MTCRATYAGPPRVDSGRIRTAEVVRHVPRDRTGHALNSWLALFARSEWKTGLTVRDVETSRLVRDERGWLG